MQNNSVQVLTKYNRALYNVITETNKSVWTADSAWGRYILFRCPLHKKNMQEVRMEYLTMEDNVCPVCGKQFATVVGREWGWHYKGSKYCS